MSVLDFIPCGATNAVTAERIAEQMGIDTRSVQNLVQIERLRGNAVCASCTEPYGFFVAENPKELSLYCQSLLRRGMNTLATYNALQNALDIMTGQGRMEDFFEEETE